MGTRVKIKINDDGSLREELDRAYSELSQILMCKFALLLAAHSLETIGYEDMENQAIKEGYAVNEAWQRGEARMHDVRQAGFRIHQLAKKSEDAVTMAALRVVGQAVATGHMKEHAMVASDYAVKVINLLYPDDLEKVREERRWQISALRSVAKEA